MSQQTQFIIHLFLILAQTLPIFLSFTTDKQVAYSSILAAAMAFVGTWGQKFQTDGTLPPANPAPPAAKKEAM